MAWAKSSRAAPMILSGKSQGNSNKLSTIRTQKQIHWLPFYCPVSYFYAAQALGIQHLDDAARDFDQSRVAQYVQHAGEGFRGEIKLGCHRLLGGGKLNFILVNRLVRRMVLQHAGDPLGAGP